MGVWLNGGMPPSQASTLDSATNAPHLLERHLELMEAWPRLSQPCYAHPSPRKHNDHTATK